MVIVAIAGGTGSGKTTLAKKIIDSYQNIKITLSTSFLIRYKGARRLFHGDHPLNIFFDRNVPVGINLRRWLLDAPRQVVDHLFQTGPLQVAARGPVQGPVLPRLLGRIVRCQVAGGCFCFGVFVFLCLEVWREGLYLLAMRGNFGRILGSKMLQY